MIGKAYKGYRVNHPTAREVREIYEVLIALTELSLTLAMQRADDEQLSELLALVEAMERGLAEGRISEYGVAVANFRRRAVAFSQNETLARLYDQLVNQPAHIKLWAIDDLIAVKRRAPDLTRLRLALLEGDGATAGRVMADKMQRALNDVLAELEEKEANMSR
ncbi:MAG: FCD domain-containing protein [Chloroflexi bacterium]|nr:FCD domain-containing protein [Chloroflexota bacterium]